MVLLIFCHHIWVWYRPVTPLGVCPSSTNSFVISWNNLITKRKFLVYIFGRTLFLAMYVWICVHYYYMGPILSIFKDWMVFFYGKWNWGVIFMAITLVFPKSKGEKPRFDSSLHCPKYNSLWVHENAAKRNLLNWNHTG